MSKARFSKNLITYWRQWSDIRFFLMFVISWFFMSFLVLPTRSIRKERAFMAYTKDSVQLKVDVIYNVDNEPIKYYSYVDTPVCEEGVCYNLLTEVYWDLLGNFIDYKEVSSDPLTKFDHIRFTKEDHDKMKEILKDKTSLLASYKAKDLVDQRIQIKSDVIDGVAGATYKSLSGAVVRGAVYSSHTLWHIVNGKIADSIVAHTESMMSDKLLVQMLNSDNYNLQFYALNHIPSNEERYVPYLIGLLTKGASYVPFFAVEKIPDHVWTSNKHQLVIINLLEELNFEMQNEILNRLQNKILAEDGQFALISNLEELKESQLKKAFNILDKNKALLSKKNIEYIANLLESQNSELSNLAYQFLVSMQKEAAFVSKKLKEYRKG